MSGGPRPAGADRLVIQLAAAINSRSLYAITHPRVRHTVAQVCETLRAVCDDRGKDEITLLRVGEELVVDQRPLVKGGLYLVPVVRALDRCQVERLTLGRDLEEAEGHQLVDALATGREPASSPHVIVGQLDLPEGVAAGPAPTGQPGRGAGGGDGGEGTELPESTGLTPDQLAQAREAFVRLRSDPRAGLGRIESLVWGFMDELTRSTRAVLPLAPLREHDEYTFVHSVNVSLLVLAQGQALGIRDQALHAIGVAGLVHDIGKLTTPLEVLNKPGRLDGEEWRVMMQHAERGAIHLCSLQRTAPLSIVVAYEHHLRFDGQPNYPVLRVARRPTLASQLTAIADAYDAICTTRPYKKARSQAVALEILTARIGTFYDPFLVASFRRLLGTP